jgi:hypothetical protein
MIVGTVEHQTMVLPMRTFMDHSYALVMLSCFQLMHTTSKKHMICMGKTDVHGQSCTVKRHAVRLVDNINNAHHVGMSSPVGPCRNTVVMNQ